MAIESTLADASNLTVAGCDQQGAKDSYTIPVTSSSTLGTVYTVRELSGQAARSCSTPGQGGLLPGRRLVARRWASSGAGRRAAPDVTIPA